MVLNRLKQILNADGFAAGTAVFPDIDAEAIAGRLKLVQAGTEAGRANRPDAEATGFDSTEMLVVVTIEELRRRGLQQFEDHIRVYRERLSRAAEARKEVEIVAGLARGDFLSEVDVWKARLATPVETLNESFAWRAEFRRRHRLQRPAEDFGGWPKTIAIGMILILVETSLNGYLFAQNNSLGLLGGILAALLVSISNVGVSGLAGFAAKRVNHRNWLWKVAGLAVLGAWLAYAVVFNLAVAHFRDVVEVTGDWSLAAAQAIPALREAPFALGTIESWLLCVIGGLMSLLAFLKGFHTDDPYPGYGRVSRAVIDARNRYARDLETAIGELEAKRDGAIDELRDAHEEVRSGIAEAVDALFGQTALRAQVGHFLEQCDVKTARLLAVYRDANRAARTAPAPASFSRDHVFAPFTPPVEDAPRRMSAETEAATVAALVDQTIREIFASFEASVRTYREIHDIQGGGVSSVRQDTPTAAAAPVAGAVA
jgi:hypothetical protein